MRTRNYILLLLLLASSMPTALQTVWATKESEHFLFYFKQAHLNEKEMEGIVKMAEEAHHFVTTVFGMGPREKTKIYLATTADFWVTRMDFWYFRRSYAYPGEIHILCTNGSYDRCKRFSESKTLQSTFVHEFTHIVLFTEKSHIDLLTEGIATYIEEKYFNDDPHAFARFLLNNNGLVPLETLFRDFRSYDATCSYEESSSFSAFLIEEYGLEKYKELYFKDSSSLEMLDRNMGDVYGMSLSIMEAAWRERLKSRP